MSEDVLRLIAVDVGWTPDPAAARRVLRRLALLLPDAESTELELFDAVVFVDCGGNLERVGCPACGAELATSWWAYRMDTAFQRGFTDLAVTTPCCRAVTTLDDLVYAWPAGFARASFTVRSPGRGWLDDAELALLAEDAGQPFRQVMAHT